MWYLHDEAVAVVPRVLDAAGIERAITLDHSDGVTIALTGIERLRAADGDEEPGDSGSGPVR